MESGSKDQWRTFRRARVAFITVLVTVPLALWVVMSLLPRTRELRLTSVALMVGFYLPAVIGLSLSLRLWPCPRCGGSFTDSVPKSFAGLVPSRGSTCSECGLQFLEPF